ncbi:hypothetical protein GCM10010358_81380 [Streptomyces minutiscleroticus]|uniref:Uncharacterized protein n=1 Tax=Streptomyces minutiscleroticus TaxID=68238 RepID=A0A918UA94_9ACTN|nr:hypothetical protein [Streptomyces minutiscleroticus]GGY17724.1 hypothetical protein GCM10010358_81380 [Streptomyces minutiscleroticus]
MPASTSPSSPSPTARRAGDGTDRATAPPPLGLEARLALVDAAMTVRLEEAALAHEVNTAHLRTGSVEIADVVTVPLAPAAQRPPQRYTTPVAALLERACHRMETAGWCAGSLADASGAVCQLGAIRAEAGGDRELAADAARVVLEAVRRRFGDDVDSVPGFNDAWGSGRVPLRMLHEAASLADARGL